MKRNLSLILLILILITAAFSGCNNQQPPKTDYQVNKTGIINIGAILPLSGDNAQVGEMVKSGLEYAGELASKIKLDKEYTLELTVADSSDLDSAYKMFDNTVSTIVCLGIDSVTTDAIISKFASTSTPLLFVDNFSSTIAETDNALSIAISDSYLASAGIKYITEEGYSNGALFSTDTDTTFSEIFVSTASQNYINIECFDSDTFSATSSEVLNSEFIFINGTVSQCKDTVKELNASGYSGEIILSEVIDKSLLCEEEYEDVTFISKFEYDDNNYIGSDFINQYSSKNAESSNDTNSALAYGYDAYMIIYKALQSFVGHSDDLLSAVGKSAENKDSNEDAIINTSQMLTAIKEINYSGVTDEIAFDEKGLSKTNFLYIDKIEGQTPVQIDKYKF